MVFMLMNSLPWCVPDSKVGLCGRPLTLQAIAGQLLNWINVLNIREPSHRPPRITLTDGVLFRVLWLTVQAVTLALNHILDEYN
jgi:hypothetical protein